MQLDKIVRRGSNGGLSMVETVIAMGILMAGFFLFTRLFVYGVRGMDRGEDQSKAVSLALSEVARLKDLAKNNRFTDLLAEDARTFMVDGFEVSLEVTERGTYSPSTEWERPHISTPQARLLESAMLQAVVSVSGEGAESRIVTLLGRPQLALGVNSIQISNLPGGTLGANASVTLTASLESRDGTSIPVTYDWTVLPGTGNATITEQRNGRDAVLTNQVIDAFGTPVISPGSCEVQVKATYFGEEIVSAPYTVNLGS